MLIAIMRFSWCLITGLRIFFSKQNHALSLFVRVADEQNQDQKTSTCPTHNNVHIVVHQRKCKFANIMGNYDSLEGPL